MDTFVILLLIGLIIILMRYTIRVLRQIQKFESKYGETKLSARVEMKIVGVFGMYIQFIVWSIVRNFLDIYSEKFEDFVV